MPKVTLVHTNFTAGEITPKMWGRIDVARYQNGAEIIENAWPIVHGGIDKRWGTLFHWAAKIANKRARLIPFVFSRTQAYILEFGDQYMRVHTDAGVILSGGSPYEITTPFTEAMLNAMDFTQKDDTMLVFHTGVYPRRLRRFADANWVMDNAPFNPAPFDEIGSRPAATLSLSATTVGTGRTLNSDAAVFLNSDVGRQIWAGFGTATITAFTSTTQVTATINEAFDASSYTSGNWILTISPQAGLKPSATGPVGNTIDLEFPSSITSTAEASKAITGLSHDGVSTATVTIVGHGYSTGNTIQHSGSSPSGYNGTYAITVVDANTYTYSVADPGASTVLGVAARVNSTTTYPQGWRAEDVGKFVLINEGLVKVTEFVSTTLSRGTVLVELNNDVLSQANAWTLNSAVWNDHDGYPATGTFHMQRLLAAGSPSYPQTVWGSGIGDYFGFQLGANDDDAFAYALVADDNSQITYLLSMEALVALTYGGEFTMEGGVEKPITPTNIRAKQRSNKGSEQVRPVRVGSEEMFVQRAGKSVRAATYDADSGKWAVPDMSVLAEHIAQPGVTAMTWHENPGTLLFAARSDGLLASSTFDRDQDVVGWARQNLGGVVESVATAPVGDGDRTWMIVRRVINGSTVRYIEKFDPGTYVDGGIVGTSGPGATVWTGLGHLEGEEVVTLADGIPQPAQTVTGGQITLPRKAYAVQIGKRIRMRVKLLPPEVGGSGGAAQANAMSTNEVSVRVLETVGLQVNGQTVAFRQLGVGILDKAIEPFSGIKRVENLGWENGESVIEITHDDPLPCHLQSVIRKFSWNEG